MTIELKRFQIKASPKVLGVFDALCEAAHVDRDSGFNCLILEFFNGYPFMQKAMEHPDFQHWKDQTQDFVMDCCS